MTGHDDHRAIVSDPRPPSDGDDLRAVVAAQAELIEQLKQRLDRLEQLDRPVVERETPRNDGDETPTSPAVAEVPPTGLDASTSRRSLLTRGAAAAATAVIGTAAVGAAGATPAAAASGTFDGNPALRADATPSTGRAIEAYSAGSEPGAYTIAAENSAANGVAIAGRAVATTGEGIGVLGTTDAGGVGVAGSSVTGTGVYGRSENYGSGVEGSSAFGNAVFGGTGAAIGVFGTAWHPSGIGVAGRHDGTAGTAVRGVAESSSGATKAMHGITKSGSGVAVYAEAQISGTGIVSHTDGTHLRFAGSPAAPPAAGVARLKGEMVFDTNADLWLCVAAGTPGTWRKVSGAATAGSFTILPSTIRIYDSRAGLNPVGVTKGQLGNFAERTIDAKTNGAVPAGATAVLVNLTIVNTGDPGYLGLFKNGITWPGNTTINWNQPLTLLANSAICALDDQARFAVKSNVGFCDFVIDAVGYYR